MLRKEHLSKGSPGIALTSQVDAQRDRSEFVLGTVSVRNAEKMPVLEVDYGRANNQMK